MSIPVLHPYNRGWAGFVTVVNPFGNSISELSEEPKGFELKVAEYVVGHGAFWNKPKLQAGGRNDSTASIIHCILDCCWVVHNDSTYPHSCNRRLAIARTVCLRQPLKWLL
jgi:hypothetical protein